jgi:uncharacterized CHY-type Zn-finger protein
MNTVTERPFKFRFVQNGNVQGLRSKEGNAGISTLTLDNEEIPYSQISDTTSRDSRLVLLVQNGQTLGENSRKQLKDNTLVLHIYKEKALDLEKHIDRLASHAQAEQHRNALIQVKQGDKFRAVVCPHCQATINLTEYDKTRHIYCRFCESILDYQGQLVANGDDYRICDECNMFDQVQGYTVFYFYFLLIVYGFRYNRRHMCNTCAAKQAPKTLLINLPFLLGVPSALYMWYKAVTGHDPALKELSNANKLAKSGKYQEADKIYDKLLMGNPGHPGILLNKAMGHMKGEDGAGMVAQLNESLRGGSNYMPALRMVRNLQQAVNKQPA